MVSRSLSEHISGCFYSSESLSSALIAQIESSNLYQLPVDQWPFNHSEFYGQLVKELDQRYPRKYRLDDIRKLMDNICDGDLFQSSRLPWLSDLFSRLMKRNGDYISYKETEVQAYVRLAAEMDPTLLVAWHLSDWVQTESYPSCEDIRRIVSAQTAFFAPIEHFTKRYAEGHVHIGGVTADNAILESYLLSLEWKVGLTQSSKESPTLIKKIESARKILRWLIDFNKQESDFHTFVSSYENQRLNGPQAYNWELLAETCSRHNVSSQAWLFGAFARAMHSGCANRWLWLHLYLCARYRDEATMPTERMTILSFFQITNDIRRELIMDGQGLTRFVEDYFSGPLGRGKNAKHDNMRRLFPSNKDLVELKSSLGSFNATFVKGLVADLADQAKVDLPKPPYIFGEDEIEPDSGTLAYLETLERWQYCGHFSRSQKNRIPSKGTKADVKIFWKEAEKLMRKLQSQEGWNKPEFLGGFQNPNFYFQPSRWFRGLDVAGNENDLKVEWFAPIIRWLRRGLVSRPDGEKASQGFHLSIHTGEDYAHPVSGMRHIDETVKFCEMRDGDRLGHALALGIVPRTWIERQGEMVLPIDEHLDNLVWMWHYATMLSGHISLANQVLPILERRIARFWKKIAALYDESVFAASESSTETLKAQESLSVSPDTLYRAWWLRRNCHYRLAQLIDDSPRSAQEIQALPDICLLKSKGITKKEVEVYYSRHRYISNAKQMPLVVVSRSRESFAHITKPSNQNKFNIHYDTDTDAEIDFMEALQDFLMDQYDREGLIIETNPTSNVYIARLEKHSEHPIFRWHPPDEATLQAGGLHNKYGLRRGPSRVMINTDDPGIMPTTLRTEFLLLREASIELGIGRTVAERWLEELRVYGIEQFRRNHLPVFETI
ncbi:antiviral RADAR system adenosine deaminase RdrB [Salinivibrio proteolyticus]|uniref:Adenosine deaminase n=1 Tax=Salinivibrio proteolyticus TaxID=334715 RepID=A0ABY7LGI3_9GAMM|nr:antiviral RADAR system adenosine deaminase RdrB [Salinivibrio proteolyticus]WBA15491.1 hypothetical protein N7E60_04130 [Salinivibrio proteolyticus]